MKLDLHVHTAYSDDGMNPPGLVMRMIRKRGLDGLAVTDHNNMRAWQKAKEAARRHGLLLVPAEEVRVLQEGREAGDMLALFLNEEIPKGDVMDVMDRIRQQDGVAVAAHPFDRVKGFRNLESFAANMDAIECFNSRLPSSRLNDIAFEFASRKGLGMTGGSDAHVPWEVGLAYTVADVSDLEGFRKALKRRETRFFGRMNFPICHMASAASLVPKKIARKLD